MTAGTTATAFPPHTRVRIIGGTSKTKGKDGFIGTDKPDYRNLGKLPILVGHQNKRVWCRPEWLQPYNEIKSEPEAQLSSDPELQPEDESQPIEDEKTGTLTSPLGYVLDPASCELVNYPVVHDPVEQEPLTKYLALDLIATDGGTQSRAGLNYATIDEYAEAQEAGATFPPILVFYDGEEYWLADGFHRVEAASRLEWTDIAVVIRSGTRRDAVLYSVGANAEHGLRRTNADKRRAVETLLRDEEWSQWSDREIARRARVSTPFVSKLRPDLSVNGLQIERTVRRNGTDYSVDTANIGKKAKKTGVVERLKQKDPAPVPLEYSEGDVVEIRAGANSALRPVDGYWGIVTHVGTWSCSVHISLKSETFQCKDGEVDKVTNQVEAQLAQQVSDRIKNLMQRDDITAMVILNLDALSRKTSFTEQEIWLLGQFEDWYGMR